MPDFPLYYEAQDELKNVMIELTDDEEEQRKRDLIVYMSLDEYQAPFRTRWMQNGGLYNLMQAGTDDPVVNWYLGWGRLIINYAVSTMTEGEPEGDFDPVGPSDYKKKILWDALAKWCLNKCNWQAHQRLWLNDNHIFGSGVLNSYSELPTCRRRYVDEKGKTITKFMRDFRKAKVGIRHRSPWRSLRSHWVSDPDDVPVGIMRETLTWNAFANKYGNAVLPDGSKKYETDGLPVGTHVELFHIFDEEGDGYRLYALPWGNRPESTVKLYADCPTNQLGKPIYDKPLSRYKFMEQGRALAGGVNVPGMTPLAFSILDDQLDHDYQTHALYGMGIPEIIQAPEAIMNSLVNQTNLNLTLKNTVPISYEPLNPDSPSMLNVDVGAMYSGLMMDGKVLPQPLGTADVTANMQMWNWLNELFALTTGYNFNQFVGDDLKTAYQSGLRNRQNNQCALSRIRAWEQGPLKRAWTIMLANALSDLTVPEYGEITEDDAKRMADAIGNDQATGEDFIRKGSTNEDGTVNNVNKKRVHIYVPVKGKKFREDFTGTNKTRTMDPNSRDNTLVEDPKMAGNMSKIPLDGKYFLPTGDIESILQFDCRVDGKHMLGDLKAQDMELSDKAISNAVEIAQVSPETAQEIDWKKMLITANRPAGYEESDMFKDSQQSSGVLDSVKKLLTNVQATTTSPPPNAAPPVPQDQASLAPAPVPPQPQQPGGSPLQPPVPPALLSRVANGTV